VTKWLNKPTNDFSTIRRNICCNCSDRRSLTPVDGQSRAGDLALTRIVDDDVGIQRRCDRVDAAKYARHLTRHHGVAAARHGARRANVETTTGWNVCALIGIAITVRRWQADHNSIRYRFGSDPETIAASQRTLTQLYWRGKITNSVEFVLNDMIFWTSLRGCLTNVNYRYLCI